MTYHTKHQNGRSALSLAAERGYVDVMKVLIEKGADVNTQDEVIMYRNLMHVVNMWLRKSIIVFVHICTRT